MSPIFYIFWSVVILVIIVLVGAKVGYGAPTILPDNNTTLPNKSGSLDPALCCHQFGEGNEWGDSRR